MAIRRSYKKVKTLRTNLSIINLSYDRSRGVEYIKIVPLEGVSFDVHGLLTVLGERGVSVQIKK